MTTLIVYLTIFLDDENEKVKPIASGMKLLGSARSRKGESHSGWNVVGGNDVVDTWKSGDTQREEKERRRGDEKKHIALMNERIVREPRVFCTRNFFV